MKGMVAEAVFYSQEVLLGLFPIRDRTVTCWSCVELSFKFGEDL